MPDYFVLTQFIIDDLYFPNSIPPMLNKLGGGVYAVAGMRTWSPKVGFCCGVGPDFQDSYDSWFLKNRIEMALCYRPKKCIHSKIVYFEDGERSEEAQSGFGNYSEMMPEVDEIPLKWYSAKGMYFYKDCSPEYWSKLDGFFSKSSAVTCWEILSPYATSEHRNEIAACLPKVELFSTNITEGRRMTGEVEALEVVRGLLDLGANQLILRMGAKGAIIADRSTAYHIPAAPTNVVDVTGGGNSSTGAFLTGYCQSGGNLVTAGIRASIAASYIIQQYSVPDDMDVVMEQARNLEKTIQAEKLSF